MKSSNVYGLLGLSSKHTSNDFTCECTEHEIVGIKNTKDTPMMSDGEYEEMSNETQLLATKIEHKWYINKTSAVIALLQVLYLALFTAYVSYAPEAHAGSYRNSVRPAMGGFKHQDLTTDIKELIMVTLLAFFLGIRDSTTQRIDIYKINSILILSSITYQWSILCRGLISFTTTSFIELSIKRLTVAQFSVISVITSQGFLKDDTSLLHMIVVQLIGVPLHVTVEDILENHFQVLDVGQSVSVFLFGSVFGLSTAMASYSAEYKALKQKSSWAEVCNALCSILCLICWISISMNSVNGGCLRRVVINTFLAMSSAVSVGYPLSVAFSPTRKLKIVSVMNAMISTAVAVSPISPLMLHGYGSVLVGIIASTFCMSSEFLLQPRLKSKCQWMNVTGSICYLTGGFLAGILSAIGALTASPTLGQYGYSLYQLYKARVPRKGTEEFFEAELYVPIKAGEGRSAKLQSLYQLAGLATAIAAALIGGILTGLLLRLPLLKNTKHKEDAKLTDSHLTI